MTGTAVAGWVAAEPWWFDRTATAAPVAAAAVAAVLQEAILRIDCPAVAVVAEVAAVGC